MSLTVRRERTVDGFVITLNGNLDSRLAVVVSQGIVSTSRMTEPESSLVLDLSEVNFLDAGALPALVGTVDRLRQDGVKLQVVARGDVAVTGLPLSTRP